MNRDTIKEILKEILEEEQNPGGVRLLKLPDIQVSEQDRLDTGDPLHRVFTHDALTLEQSPRLGCGIMEMERSTFPWTLRYDEIDYVISGCLTIYMNDRSVTAKPGEAIFIPKDSSILFSASEKTRFLYVTYPADWQTQ